MMAVSGVAAAGDTAAGRHNISSPGLLTTTTYPIPPCPSGYIPSIRPCALPVQQLYHLLHAASSMEYVADGDAIDRVAGVYISSRTIWLNCVLRI
jgi:hypothetical protein